MIFTINRFYLACNPSFSYNCLDRNCYVMESRVIVLSDYIRPGKTIGIIGGSSIARFLALRAKKMGFFVHILDPRKDCAAASIADLLIQAEYNDLRELERLGRMCDVVAYTTDKVDVDILSCVNEMNLPQGTDMLAITQDLLMQKGFLEDNGINVAPYATIVMITDIEENIDGIGYPCYLRPTREDDYLELQGPQDIVEAMDVVKGQTCILESSIPDAKEYSISIARNEKGEMMLFPIVRHYRDEYEGYLNQVTTQHCLPEEVEEEMRRIAKKIALGLSLKGLISIEFNVTEMGAIYVDRIIPRLYEGNFYSEEVCGMTMTEAFIRSLCNWPLEKESKLESDCVTVMLYGRDISTAQRQIQSQPHWHFYFYDRDDAITTTRVGHINVPTTSVEKEREAIDGVML